MAETPRDRLVEELRRGSVVAVVGAGVSIAATANTDVASWKGLLKSGVDRCLAAGLVDDPGWPGRVRLQIEGDLIDLLCAAENVAWRLGAPDGGDYASWLQDTIGKLRATDTAVLKALTRLGVPIVTTNYDDLIEAATGLREVVWTEHNQMHSFSRGASDGVLHVHGHWRYPRTVILGLRSYETLRRDDTAQALLHALLSFKTLLFVGFGSGLQDPNFGSLLIWGARVFGTSMFPSYQLCLQADEPQVRALHAGRPIRALAYGAHHVDLVTFLEGLAP